MNREKMLQNPLPIDKTAYRVIKKARPEDLWQPMPKYVEGRINPGEVPKIAPIPANVRAQLLPMIGARRGRMTLIGYAAEQRGNNDNPASWIVRCDCGNYASRKRIFRWLGTKADDMCAECHNRLFKIKGEFMPREKARRATVEAA